MGFRVGNLDPSVPRNRGLPSTSHAGGRESRTMKIGPIANRQGEVLDYSLHPGAPDAKDIVVIGHGVTGNKDRPFHIALADGFSAAGIHALRVSWSGNGGSAGSFADSTVTK